LLTKIDVKYGNATKIACLKGTLGEKGVVRILVKFRVFDFCVNSILSFLQEVFMLSCESCISWFFCSETFGCDVHHLCAAFDFALSMQVRGQTFLIANETFRCAYIDIQSLHIIYRSLLTSGYPWGDHWAKIVEQRAIKNRVQYIHCR